jgi:hypothetical protein
MFAPMLLTFRSYDDIMIARAERLFSRWNFCAIERRNNDQAPTIVVLAREASGEPPEHELQEHRAEKIDPPGHRQHRQSDEHARNTFLLEARQQRRFFFLPIEHLKLKADLIQISYQSISMIS